MKRFLELLTDRKEEIDEQLLEILFSFTEYQTFKEIMLNEKKRIENQKKKKMESINKKPQKPLKQSSNTHTNIFSVEKKDLFLKEEQKTDLIPQKKSKTEKNKVTSLSSINENSMKIENVS